MYLNDYCCILLHSILKYRQKGSDSMTTVSLRFDDEMKKQLDEMCDEMGMNLTTFFMIYAKKALRDRRIPFEVTAPLDQQIHKGQVVVKTMEELEAMEGE